MIDAVKSAYERLFVAFYAWSLRVDGKKTGLYNVYYAALMLSLALLLNFSCVLMALELISGWQFLTRFLRVPKVWIAIIALIFAISQFLYFSVGARYQDLVRRHSVNERALIQAPRKALLTYMILSVMAVVALFCVRADIAAK